MDNLKNSTNKINKENFLYKISSPMNKKFQNEMRK